MNKTPSVCTLRWKHQYRIIPSHFPPINFFENIVDPFQMEEAFYIENLTNDRLLEEIGELSLVKPEDRLCGKGASIVMAAFTHIGRPSRFTNGSYGVYYCAKELTTAIQETVYSRSKFLSYTQEAPGDIDMRVYIGKVIKPMHDIREGNYSKLHHPADYSIPQTFSETLRKNNSWGIVYNSVRHKGGECIAALRPPAVSIPIQSKHLAYVWDGTRITDVYEKTQVLATV